ncbi:MAG: SDR family NAD(P)-dependent oxidoreductase [Acholeplasmataceae bacterium]
MIIKDHVVVLTGASSGIGRDLMLLLLEEGAYVLAVSRTIESDDLEHERLIKRNGDLSDHEAVDELFEFALRTYGRIDAFIANAGFTYYERLTRASYEHIERIYSLNTLSAIYSAVKMKEIHGDKPFNFLVTQSAVSFLAMPGYALYNGTKAALRGFMDGFRLEMGPGQHLQSVYPVATRTKFFERAGQKHKPWPVQTSEHVARVMLKGLKRNRKDIFPSRLFRYGYKLFPWFFKLYVKRQTRIFDRALPE